MTQPIRRPGYLPCRQLGLSLVELMIALTLGLILTLGVTQVFLGSSKTYRTTDAISLLQENLRFSMTRISQEVRMAGNQGCLVGQPTDHLGSSATGAGAAFQWVLSDPDLAVIGWEAPKTGLGKKVTVSGFTYGGGKQATGTSDTAPKEIRDRAMDGTDFLVITGGDRLDVVLQGNTSAAGGTEISTQGNSGIEKNVIIVAVQEGCDGGDRFQNANAATVANLKTGNGSLHGYSDNAAVYAYRSRGYFIGEGVDNEPALFRIALTPGEGARAPSGAPLPVELVRGVENMQILYGVAGPLRSVERYVPASSVTDWTNVVSVRIGLLMRSDDQVLEEDTADTFNLIGTEVAPGTDRRARLVGNLTVGIRGKLE